MQDIDQMNQLNVINEKQKKAEKQMTQLEKLLGIQGKFGGDNFFDAECGKGMALDNKLMKFKLTKQIRFKKTGTKNGE